MRFDKDGFYIPNPPKLYVAPPEPEPAVNPIPGKLLTSDQLSSIPAPTWIIRGLIATGSMAWIAGAPGAYKSFMAIDWACATSLGVNTVGGRSTKRTKVIYMAGEGVGGLKPRVEAWWKSTGMKPDVMWLPEAVQVGQRDWQWLEETTQETGAGLLVIDTYARSTIGLEEISGAAQGIMQGHMDAYRKTTGAAILAVHHHSAAGKTLRGHTSLEGAADKIVTLTKDDNGVATMCHYKQKETDKDPDEYYRASPSGESITLTSCEQPLQDEKTTTQRRR
jgi:hypothetical protein